MDNTQLKDLKNYCLSRGISTTLIAIKIFNKSNLPETLRRALIEEINSILALQEMLTEAKQEMDKKEFKSMLKQIATKQDVKSIKI